MRLVKEKVWKGRCIGVEIGCRRGMGLWVDWFGEGYEFGEKYVFGEGVGLGEGNGLWREKGLGREMGCAARRVRERKGL